MDDALSARFAQNVKQLRDARGMTQQQMAKLAGDILLEDNRDRKAKLQKDRALKSALLERLKSEALQCEEK